MGLIYLIYNLFSIAIDIYLFILIIRVILTWVPSIDNSLTDFVRSITDPLLDKFNVNIPMGGVYMDISPLIIYFGLTAIRYLVRIILF